MTSLAQGKRSDTLGKPPPPITPRPARAKVNITHSVSALCTYMAQTTQHIISRAPLRLPWAMNFCPFRACPLKRALIERFSACEKIDLRSVGELFSTRMATQHPTFHIQHPTFNISHSTFHILNTPPPNLHGFSRCAPPRVPIRHSRRVIATA